MFFQPPWSTFVKVTVEQSYGDWTRVLTGIQTQNEAGAQPGASNLNRKCLWQNKLCYCRKEPEIRNEERPFFYFIGLKPQDPAFLKHWESSGFIPWPTALQGFFFFF